MATYNVIYMNDQTKHSVCIAGPFRCLKDAAEARKLSGDLVVDGKGKVIKDPSWLWDWEKADPKSYAHMKVKNA